MQIEKTNIPHLLVINPRVFEDNRGYFFESYNERKFLEHDLKYPFVQDNESLSTYGTIRGLHYQLAPHAQAKLVRVITGKIFDVAVDIREGSPTFGQWHGIELSEENKKQMLIPKGFAHGFSVLSDSAIVFYKCDDFYHPESERGIFYHDESLKIDWRIDPEKTVVSEKDQNLPELKHADMNFSF
ncbi:MAG: dTDP-4-dehydrorhamnose 3,5-epimerase [Bacteroidales bacterium]|nr:dTDP-4-dehydrorhamnose 3,5-epimerase [Bacteroidales bacterium]MBS3774156.1 dTDP-4-dehydrorhamnose 3,5-epimerase [Bacteroidales bacterium]